MTDSFEALKKQYPCQGDVQHCCGQTPCQWAIDAENFARQQKDNDRRNAARAGYYLQEICHRASKDAGWWTAKDGTPVKNNPYAFSNKLALIHSEISEAMEGDRKGLMDDKLPHRQMREVELADAVIRIFDLAGAYSMDLGGAIAEKMLFNATRPDHQPAARAVAGGKTY